MVVGRRHSESFTDPPLFVVFSLYFRNFRPSFRLYLRTFVLPPISVFATHTITNNHRPERLHKLRNSRKSITSRPERRKIFVTRERIKSIICGGMVISAVTRLYGMFFRPIFNPASGWYSRDGGVWRWHASVRNRPWARTGQSSQAATLGVPLKSNLFPSGINGPPPTCQRPFRGVGDKYSILY